MGPISPQSHLTIAQFNLTGPEWEPSCLSIWWFSRKVLALIVEKSLEVRRLQRLAEDARASVKPQNSLYGCVNPQEGETTMAKKIKIDRILPANSDGVDLMNYYFLPDTYALYAPNTTTPVQTGIKAGSAFSVTPPGDPTFQVTVSSIDESGASGTWSNLPAPSEEGSVTGIPGSGTYQAQAGTTPVEEEEASAASA
jgi:hypothetical protein